ncbi:DUF488 family protein [Paraburkholderia sp. NMBU_R16]|uniref:DUF488 domain-containing protein n=1 Tax=Paraburkholderia sp. NMBU_R16 TaxID=2698676 RepID=UPI001563592E|nr:DUF488 domain-containing protein [Paraburkholderia sp. NMBU_R16]NRO98840.1 DUF488 family protein [Paraburkholderia sp. NMBU_R16]
MKHGRIGVAWAYDPPGDDDGVRYLVDRVWPRGIRKDALRIEQWLRDVAPSNELRRWFGHDPQRWDAFIERYRAELDANRAAWEPLLEAASHGPVTLVYGARDPEHNQAVALRDYLERKLSHRR